MRQTGCSVFDPPEVKVKAIVLDGALKIMHWDEKRWTIEDRSRAFAQVFTTVEDAELILTALAVKYGDTEI